MKNDAMDTKSKVLQAAIDLFGLKGEVTIRGIAEKAEVNVAAINYHFGNKSNLLGEVENYYSNLLDKAQQEIFQDESMESQEKLVQWASHLVQFMFRYPALIELIVNLSTEDKNFSPALINNIYLNQEVHKLIENSIKESLGTDDAKILRYKYLQIFSGIVGLVLNHMVAKTFYRGQDVIDLHSDAEREDYVRLFIKGILAS